MCRSVYGTLQRYFNKVEDDLRAAAHRLGTRYIRVFSFYRPAGVPVEKTRDPVLAHLRAWADLARQFLTRTGPFAPGGSAAERREREWMWMRLWEPDCAYERVLSAAKK